MLASECRCSIHHSKSDFMSATADRHTHTHWNTRFMHLRHSAFRALKMRAPFARTPTKRGRIAVVLRTETMRAGAQKRVYPVLSSPTAARHAAAPRFHTMCGTHCTAEPHAPTAICNGFRSLYVFTAGFPCRSPLGVFGG